MTTVLCPECGADYVFENDGSITCMECGHLWTAQESRAVGKIINKVKPYPIEGAALS